MSQHQYGEAIEQKFATLSWGRQCASGMWERDGAEARRLFAGAERWALRVADSYYWTTEIVRAVQASSESLPDDTRILVPQIEGSGAMWWWFEKPLDIGGFPGSVAAILIWTSGDLLDHRAIAITTYGTTDGVHFQAKDSVQLREFLSVADVKRGMCESGADLRSAQAVEVDGGAAAIRLVRIVIACLLWIEQRVLVMSHRPTERHVRKRLERAGFEPADVRVVVLRRSDYETARNDGAATRHAEWECQWVVSGHWRQQFYPSTDERKPIWIMPYVKGPEDKPLKVPGSTVYAVNR